MGIYANQGGVMYSIRSWDTIIINFCHTKFLRVSCQIMDEKYAWDTIQIVYYLEVKFYIYNEIIKLIYDVSVDMDKTKTPGNADTNYFYYYL